MKTTITATTFLLLASVLLVPAGPLHAGLADDGRVGSVLDLAGTALLRPAGHDRWTPLGPRSVILPGDRVRTLQRGANAVELDLVGGGKVVLGPGAIAEFPDRMAVNLLRGEAELVGAPGAAIRLGEKVEVKEKAAWVRRQGKDLQFRGEEFRWLTGYRASSTSEWMGSLIADVDGRNVPLTIGYHKVSVVIRDQIAETTVEESFVNSTPGNLEGTFTFPLPADASISGFGMWVGDELVMADIVERGRAREIYEDILRRKKDPGLLEWSGGNLFKARVFPIPAHGEKRIKIRYTQVLPLEGTKLRYRYALRSELLRAHPLRALSIRVRAYSTLPIEAAGSPSHEVATEATEHEVKISYDAEEVTPERDFEAELTLGSVKPLTVIPHRRGPDGYFLLLLSPPDPEGSGWKRELAPEGDPVDLVLLADTSGSMEPGQRETQAAFLESLLSLLGPEDTFQLGAVDDGVTWQTTEPRPATERNVADALAFVASRASLGWTDLDRGIAGAITRSGPKTHVVYVGDGIGTAGDPDASALVRRIGRLAEKAAGTFHAVSTGSSYERRVLEAIASIGGGSVREAAADPADAAFRLLAEIARPPVKNLSVRFEGVRTARVYPKRLPNLPAGNQQAVLGRFLPGREGTEGSVTVTGTHEGRPVRYTAPFVLDEKETGNSFLPRLWARRHVDALLAEKLTPQSKADVVAFSAEFGIMTPLTSFLVLESDADRERYGVERRVGMRDGERFFAEAKAKVDTELLREAMRKAASYRQHLTARVMAEIEDLGRSLTTGTYWQGDRTIGIGGGGGGAYPDAGGKARTSSEPLLKDAKIQDHNETDNDMPFEEGLGDDGLTDAPFEGPAGEVPPGTRPPADPAPPAARPAPAKRMASSEADGYVAGGLRRAQGRSYFGDGRPGGAPLGLRDLLQSRSEGRSARSLAGLAPQVLGLFPNLPGVIPAPAEAPPSDFPAEVIEVLAPLDRSEAIDAYPGGLEIVTESGGRHPLRPEWTSHFESTALVAPGVWTQETRRRGTWTFLQAVGTDRRFAYRPDLRLGRARPADEADRVRSRTVPGLFTMNPILSYREWNAVLEARDGEKTTVRFTHESNAVVLVVDTKRSVPLELRTYREGKLAQKTRWSEWKFVDGLPFPGRTVSLDSKGRETWRQTTEVEAREADTVRTTVSIVVATIEEDGILLGADDPDLETAKQAIEDEEAGFVERLVVALDRVARGQWDEALEEWNRAKELVPDRLGARYIEATLLRISRHGAELKALLDRLATGDGIPPTDAYAAERAEMIFSLASGVLGANEQLALLAKLRPALGRSAWLLARQNRRVANLLEGVGRRDEAIAIRQRLVEDDPADPGLRRALANSIQNAKGIAPAIDALKAALPYAERWLPQEASAVYQHLASLLWSSQRIEEFLGAVDGWIAADPAREDARERRLVALLLLGRIEELDREVLRALATDLGESPAPGAVALLGASIAHALGHSWGYWNNRLFPQWVKPLGDAALRLARRDDAAGDLAIRILSQGRFRQTDAYRGVIAALREDLLAAGAAEKLPLPKLARLLGLIHFAPNQATDEEFEILVTGLEKRFRATEDADARRTVAHHLVSLYDVRQEAEAALDLLRRWRDLETENRKAPVVQRIVDRLLQLPYSAEVESEALSLIPSLVPPKTEPAAAAGIVMRAVRQVSDGLLAMRRNQLLGTPEERDALSRAELRARTAAAEKESRGGLSARLRSEAENSSELLSPWFRIEALCLAVESGEDPTAAEGEARELLLSPPAVPAPELGWILVERASLVLDWLAIRRDAPEGLAERVLALAEKRLAGASEENRSDRRYRLFRLLVALDRPEAIVTALRSWIEPGKIAAGASIALAYVLAELGRLKEAAAELEDVAKRDELPADGYQTLATWYLALGEDEARDRSLTRYHEGLDEWRLGQLVWQQVYRVRTPGPDGVPPDLDPEVFRIERILMEKASYPANHLYQIRELYERTKDFRLLAGIADGIVGHSPEAIYPFLTQCWGILSNVHEEATLDEVADRIGERIEKAKIATDRRGLRFLTALVRRRAAEVKNRPELHAELALPALKAAFPDEWLPGEMRLLADFLASLGRIPVEALAAEQLRQLAEIHRLVDLATPDGTSVAAARARTLWAYGRRDEAVDILSSALDAARAANGGRLGNQMLGHVNTLVSWHEAMGRFRRGESYLTEELDRQEKAETRSWLILRRFDLYVHALGNRAEVSLGEGEELYRATFIRMEEALTALPPGEVNAIVNKISALAGNARRAAHVKSVNEDLIAFARGRLRAGLARVPGQEQNLYAQVADTVGSLGDSVGALTLLVEKLESDPAWYERTGRHGWPTFASRMARFRAERRIPGPLARRLARIVLEELESTLLGGRDYGSSFWNCGSSTFWAAKADAFATVARRVVETHPDSPSILLRAARYLWHGLRRKAEAVDVLVDLDRRGGLPDDCRYQLATWLAELGRHAEAIPHFELLIRHNPDRLDARARLVRSYHGAARDADGKRLVDETEARWKRRNAWGPGVMQALAEACFQCGYWERGAKHFEELAGVQDRLVRARRLGSGALSATWGRLAECQVKLGREDEAVRAATAAVVSWGRDVRNRGQALRALNAVLAGLSDLDGWVAKHDAEVAETGLDAPVIRKALGEVYAGKKQWERSARQLRLALELQPLDRDVHERLVDVLTRANKPGEAIAARAEMVRLYPADLAAILDLGTRLREAGRAKEAERAFTSLVEGEPLMAAGHGKLAEIRAEEKRWPEAIEQRRIAKGLREFDPATWFSLVETLRAAGETDAATEVLTGMLSRTWSPEAGDVRSRVKQMLR